MPTTWKVRPFGRDCFGNCSGYEVHRGSEIAQRFIADIYAPSSHATAKLLAQIACDHLNSKTSEPRP